MAATIQGNLSITGVVDGDGRLTVPIRPTNAVIWTVSQVTAELMVPDGESVPAGADCNLRKNGYLLTPLVPNGDAAGGDPAIQLLPADVITVEWSGCQPGHIGKVLAIYDVSEF